ncbi:MAG TPA: hypothetical protein VFX61_05755 [Micromonosporaceae bacterium]|nr:hypothetical protein [Micromonosporaceae bacterium]
MRRLSVLLTLLLLAGCSVGEIRRPAPTPQGPPSASVPAVPAEPLEPFEIRRAGVPVPGDFDQNHVEFTDVDQGYVLFTRCGQASSAGRSPTSSCTAIVLATDDGGRSWQQLRHPRPVAENHQLYAAGDDLLLLAEPHGWYLSADRGRSFRHEPRSSEAPAAYSRLLGRFQIEEGTGRVVEWVDDRAQPVPTQPPVPALTTVVHVGGRLFAAGEQDGRPYAAVSPDEGETWNQTVVPAPADDLIMVRVLPSPSGRDVWLVGYHTDPITFPYLWRLDGYRWEPVAAAGHPERMGGLAAIEDGMLVVTGPSGSGIIADGRYEAVGWPLGVEHVSTFDDGTLFSVQHSEGSFWFGIGHAAGRRWIKIVLDRE